MLSEARRGERKIGTTSRGIGPAYEDKIGRRGIRVCDLVDTQALADEVRENVNARNQIIKDSTLDWQPVYDQLLVYGERMRRWTGDVSLVARRARCATASASCSRARRATMLDIDHGTYPYVTSSNASIGGVVHRPRHSAAGDHGVLGVAKAYTTRVGEGPLPTELLGEMGERLRESGQEYGASTGRPRRCGWYDAVAVRYAARINGLDALALTKLDVLDGLGRIDDLHRLPRRRRALTEFPGRPRSAGPCEPVYETWPGWTAPTQGRDADSTSCRDRGAALHRAARRGERRAGRDRLDRVGSRRRSSATTAPPRAGWDRRRGFRLRAKRFGGPP